MPALAAVAAQALQAATLVAREDVQVIAEEAEDECAASFSTSHWGLRIGAVFIILATSTFATLLPILLRQSNVVPRAAFE